MGKNLESLINNLYGVKGDLINEIEFNSRTEDLGKVIRASIYGRNAYSNDFKITADIYDKTRFKTTQLKEFKNPYQIKLASISFLDDKIDLVELNKNIKNEKYEFKTEAGFSYNISTTKEIKENGFEIEKLDKIKVNYNGININIDYKTLELETKNSLTNVLNDRKIKPKTSKGLRNEYKAQTQNDNNSKKSIIIGHYNGMVDSVPIEEIDIGGKAEYDFCKIKSRDEDNKPHIRSASKRYYPRLGIIRAVAPYAVHLKQMSEDFLYNNFFTKSGEPTVEAFDYWADKLNIKHREELIEANNYLSMSEAYPDKY